MRPQGEHANTKKPLKVHPLVLLLAPLFKQWVLKHAFLYCTWMFCSKKHFHVRMTWQCMCPPPPAATSSGLIVFVVFQSWQPGDTFIPMRPLLLFNPQQWNNILRSLFPLLRRWLKHQILLKWITSSSLHATFTCFYVFVCCKSSFFLLRVCLESQEI